MPQSLAWHVGCAATNAATAASMSSQHSPCVQLGLLQGVVFALRL
jgi:hypothetical protein